MKTRRLFGCAVFCLATEGSGGGGGGEVFFLTGNDRASVSSIDIFGDDGSV